MKKINKFLLVGLLSMCFLTGCGGSNNSEGNPDEEAIVESIRVTKEPTKMVYTEFESFDPAGMEITATYSDKTERVLARSDYFYKPSGPLSAEDTTITITEKEEYQQTKLQITVNPIPDITAEPSLWIEAEKAEITVAGTNKLDCSNGLEKVENAKGGIILKNFGKTGNVLKMKVNSTADADVKIYMIVGKRPTNAVAFDDMYTLSVNETDYLVAQDLEAAEKGDFFDMVTISRIVKFKSGLNEVVLTALNDTGSNIDAFGFASDVATLSDGGTTQTIKHSDNGFYVSVKPTKISKGEYRNGCPICGDGCTVIEELPVINTTDYTVDPDDGFYVITTKDGTFRFDPKIPYRFEAEDMFLQGTSNKDKSSPCSAENNVFKRDDASGGECLRYMNYNGNVITLKFTSSEATTANWKVRVAARTNGTLAYTVGFTEMYTTTINGQPFESDVKVVPNGGNKSPLTDQFEWHVVDLGDVNIIKGENVLTFKVQPNANNVIVAANLDYMEFSSVAALTMIKAR